MLITKAPYRISFLGGSTEYVPWLRENPGLVIGTTINQYSHILIRENPPIFQYKSKLAYSEIEYLNKNSDTKHKVIRAIFDQFDIDYGIEMTHLADLPSKSGIGSSSSFIVAMVASVSKLSGLCLSKHEIYKWAVNIEQNILHENVGLQDSAWAAFGGFNAIEFSSNMYEPTVVPISNFPAIKQLEKDLLFFYTGIERQSHDIAKTYVEKKTTQNQSRILDMAKEGYLLIENGDIYRFGELINKSWEEKRAICDSISNELIDDTYNEAMKIGVYGFKLCGAGAGGCIAMLAPKGRHKKIKEKFSYLKYIPINFDQEGVKNIYG